jgi:hypothetical protein
VLITNGPKLDRLKADCSLVTHMDPSRLSEYAWKEIVVDGRGNNYLANALAGTKSLLREALPRKQRDAPDIEETLQIGGS